MPETTTAELCFIRWGYVVKLKSLDFLFLMGQRSTPEPTLVELRLTVQEKVGMKR